MAKDPAYDYYGNAPGPWTRLRARWALLPSAYRYNALLYGLAVVALAALVLEVAVGESSPRFEIATQVVPLTSTTTRDRPSSTTSTIDPSVTTTTAIGTPADPAAAGAAPAGPLGPLTPTTRRRTPGSPNPAPGSPAPGDAAPASTSKPSDSIPISTFPPLPTTQPTTPQPTSPPSSGPPPTMDPNLCEKIAPRTFPGVCP